MISLIQKTSRCGNAEETSSIFPSVRGGDAPRELEEERRLAYVAITRAQKRLFLTYARTRQLYGNQQLNPPSRFLSFEVLSEALLSFEAVGGAGGISVEGAGCCSVVVGEAEAGVALLCVCAGLWVCAVAWLCAEA